eukprot:m.1522402 g.1522402  ORF g.1522402 m.1522402 type:complete len:171 (-) comp25230_c0_seq20:5313-5825(-)
MCVVSVCCHVPYLVCVHDLLAPYIATCVVGTCSSVDLYPLQRSGGLRHAVIPLALRWVCFITAELVFLADACQGCCLVRAGMCVPASLRALPVGIGVLCGALCVESLAWVVRMHGVVRTGWPQGVYQAAESFLQMAHEAGSNQVANAHTVLLQNIGGAGSSVYSHVFVRE